ncbi:MaoC family dehydratase N-terminal domain-containing protein [Streptomyces sp. NPDC047525]|uniref:MaoC family dehydratase N-terminal domain-containing protein n=1 Tax=Streptomyces sp. NPDC047525 TaxID=3155264 RepID=UPI0033E1BBAB
MIHRSDLLLFARATGQQDPVYTDVEAARKAGHRDLPVPPTYLFCQEMKEAADPLGHLRALGVDLGKLLHGEQSFVYHAMAYAGDELTFSSEMTADYTKKALRFLVRTTEVTRGGTPIADLSATTVVTS